MKIDRPTYFIAELSGDVEPLIYGLRNKHNPERTLWPVDITIAGSSGVGTIKEQQALYEVVSKLAPIVERLSFETVRFRSVGQFPGTGIFYLEPERENFDKLHSAIIKSGILFNASRWPFNPHCTLAVVSNDEKYADLIRSVELPKETKIGCFSLYQPEPNGGARIHRF